MFISIDDRKTVAGYVQIIKRLLIDIDSPEYIGQKSSGPSPEFE